MNQVQIKQRFHIYTGFKENKILKGEFQAGEAYEVDDTEKPYYIIKMWAFPREVFYLCRNKCSDGKFTLFAKMVNTDGEIKFRRPVGFGLISLDLKKHLEIQFTFPRQRVFMSLFPDRITTDSLLSISGGVA